MDSQDTLTVDACVAGLIAFGNSAIPFLVFVTSYGYPIYEAIPSDHQGNVQAPAVRERIFGEQDVPKTAVAIRDEIVCITASLLLLQKQLLAASTGGPSREVLIHQDILVAALTRCVDTYSHFERRHFVAREEEKSQMVHDRRAFEGRPMENILAGLQQYSLLLNFVLVEMGSPAIQEVDCAVTELPSFQSTRIRKPVLTDLASFSQRPLPTKRSKIFNKSWYTLDYHGYPLRENPSTSLSPFQTFTATTCLPHSRFLGVPSDQNSPPRSWPTDPQIQARVNRKVEKNLEMWHERDARERKVVLFGGGRESIQNTFKQMKKAYELDPNTSPRKEFRYTVLNHLLRELELVIRKLDKKQWKEDHNVKTNVWAVLLCTQDELQPGDSIPTHLLPTFTNLWNNDEVKQALQEHSQSVFETFEYFFQDLHQIIREDYMPKNDDIIQFDSTPHHHTVSELVLKTNSITYRLIDIEPRGERKKVIHLLDNVAAVLFLADISLYDEVLEEDASFVRLRESLHLFESVAHSRFFQACELVLFFTNVDEFRRKIRSGTSPIRHTFPQFDDDEANVNKNEDAEAGLQFFTRLFLERHETEGRTCCVEYTYPKDRQILEKLDQCVAISLDERRQWQELHTAPRLPPLSPGLPRS